MTPASVSNWIASLADAAKPLKASTLHTYRSAVSTWWREETRSDGVNPATHEYPGRVLRGVENAQLPSRLAAPRAHATLTVELLLRMRAKLCATSGELPTRLWAACCLGVSALVRPGELFGRPPGAKQRDPPLRAAVTFFDASSAIVAHGSGGTPHAFEWRVGPTKTDRTGKDSTRLVAAQFAVRALWEWCELRHMRAEASPYLFALDNSLLTEYSVLSALTAAHSASGLGAATFSGKCFRQGGSATLIAAGVPNEDVMRAGSWKSSGMPSLYAGHSAVNQRRLAVSAASDPSWQPASGSRKPL